MAHFHAMDRQEREAAIYRLADDGYSDHLISSATQLSVDLVREVLGKRLLASGSGGRGGRL